MKPARFRYHAPNTIEEALDTLAEVAPEDGRVPAGGIEAQPRRIADAEQLLAGRAIDRAVFEAAAAAVASAVDPLDDAATSATYRRDLARTVTRRALEQAAA